MAAGAVWCFSRWADKRLYFAEFEMESDVKEGFLCPMCMQDLGTASDLHNHFEEYHSGDKAGLRQIKGMLGKAKRKIMEKIDAPDHGDGNRNIQAGISGLTEEAVLPRGMDPFLWADQDFGGCMCKIIPNMRTSNQYRISTCPGTVQNASWKLFQRLRQSSKPD